MTTGEGIILIDTLFTYNSEEEIVGGLKRLGLDPATVKYVIISHAHSDHVGGAKLMQDRFGSHIVMGGPETVYQLDRYPYLRDEMGWPIARESFEDVDDLFYDFTADELGIDPKTAAKIETIKRLRPLSPRHRPVPG